MKNEQHTFTNQLSAYHHPCFRVSFREAPCVIRVALFLPFISVFLVLKRC
jgi:hypothetical protein